VTNICNISNYVQCLKKKFLAISSSLIPFSSLMSGREILSHVFLNTL